MEPRFNDLWYNDIPGLTTNIRLPNKSYTKMYGAEPRYDDLWYNDIPGITIPGMSLTERKIISGYNDKINITDHRKCHQCFSFLKNTLDVALVIHLMINYKFIR